MEIIPDARVVVDAAVVAALLDSDEAVLAVDQAVVRGLCC
jgi:hypothetical protein